MPNIYSHRAPTMLIYKALTMFIVAIEEGATVVKLAPYTSLGLLKNLLNNPIESFRKLNQHPKYV